AICRDMSCWLRGAPDCVARARQELATVPGCEVREVSCLGRCDQAPAALVNGHPVSLAGTTDIRTSAEQQPPALPPRPRVWRSDPYESVSDRYGLLKQLLSEDAAVSRVLGTIIESGLRGMGGAGFPTAAKWELVRKEKRAPKYVICNADESEPGTFKDRVLLADLPHLVIEGMLLAGLATGAERGILFIRHEYKPERRTVERTLL